jgi:hypothetical protein
VETASGQKATTGPLYGQSERGVFHLRQSVMVVLHNSADCVLLVLLNEKGERVAEDLWLSSADVVSRNDDLCQQRKTFHNVEAVPLAGPGGQVSGRNPFR